MVSVELKDEGGLAYREAVPEEETGAPVLLVHGFPESSLMWVAMMEALAADGRRALAPDLHCLGDSKDPGPATYERNVAAFEAWVDELELEEAAVVVHDWGAFIGLTWACKHPAAVDAMVISDSGFFSDGRWHGIAELIRGEGGEELMGQLNRETFEGILNAEGAEFTEEEIEAYWRPFEEGRGRQATVEFYRSMDFQKLTRYQGALAALAVPTLILWGAEDQFAPISGGYRFEREIAGSKLVSIPGAGHFVYETAREECVDIVSTFLRPAGRG
jgi:haloalkane dehalogenase